MKKILIVEDDLKIAAGLAFRLKATGYAALIANDAVMAPRLARQFKPDLILLDISLPGGNGLQLAALKGSPEFTEPPIIFLTASSDPELLARAMLLRPAAVLQKPYDPEKLLQTIQLALDGVSCLPIAAVSPPASVASAKKVLIIEDDRKITTALTFRLQAEGYEVFAAGDAIAGLNSAVRNQPDLVLMDISMPAGDGFLVAERIQALIPKLTPIIFITASKKPGLRQRASELGGVAFLEKPYNPEELLGTMREALNN
ncbi:MAG: czcR 2 [Verrucomicrobiales bacterium]|nr:czcR 2 [Verrucomicrobiales bacterium]